MSIADNIKALREAHDMNQAEFGAIAGVTDKAVSSWENGTKTPRMGAIQKLADHFGIKKSDIIEDDPSLAGLDAIQKKTVVTGREYIMINLYRQLSEEDQIEAESYIKFKWLQMKEKEKEKQKNAAC